MNFAATLCTVSSCLLLLSPAFAQNPVSLSPNPFHQETDNKKILHGIDTLVLVVKQTNVDAGKIVKDDKQLVMDVDRLRKNVADKLNAVGIKTITEAEQLANAKNTTGMTSTPRFYVGIVTSKQTYEDGKILYWWSATIRVEKQIVSFDQLQNAGKEVKSVDVYTLPVWSSDAGASLMPDESFDHSVDRDCSQRIADFIKEWRVANNRQVFDSFPKH